MYKQIISILALIPFGLSAMQDNKDNLLKNGDFEQNLTLWQIEQGIAWTDDDGYQETGGISMEAEYVPDDDYIHEVSASQCIAITNASLFSVSASFIYDDIPESSYGHRLNIYWYRDKNCRSGGQFGTYLEPKLEDGWQTLSRSNLKPMLNAQSIKVALTQNQKHAVLPLGFFARNLNKIGFSFQPDLALGVWDNLELTATQYSQKSIVINSGSSKIKLPIGDNHISNNNFDENFEGWYMSNQSQQIAEPGALYNGILQTRLTSNKNSIGSGVGYICIEFGQHKKYELGIRFRRSEQSTQTGNVRLRPTWYENTDCTGRSSTSRDHADSSDVDYWQDLIVKDLSPSPQSKSVKVELIQVVDGKGEFIGYWDEAYFKAVQ